VAIRRIKAVKCLNNAFLFENKTKEVFQPKKTDAHIFLEKWLWFSQTKRKTIFFSGFGQILFGGGGGGVLVGLSEILGGLTFFCVLCKKNLDLTPLPPHMCIYVKGKLYGML
jgi:hypothetical protein